MELKHLLSIQDEFDKAHGWDITSMPPEDRLQTLERELVGLVGEVGEVANLVKKARLMVGREKSSSISFQEIAPDVKEELIDIFIYLLRMFQVTDADIEKEYLQKLAINENRFKKYESRTS